MTTPQPQQESEQMQDKQLKHTDKSFCYCIIDPDSEPEHDCDSNHCTSLDHVRKGCRCGFDRASNSHHKNDCAFCRTSKESLQVDLSLCNSMSHRVYGKCKNCGGIEQKSTEPYVTPELTEEQRTVSVIYACVKEERLDWAINYLKTYVIQELELQRREYEEETEQLILLLHRKTKGRMNFTEEDLSGISYERRMKWQLSYEALLQKEQSVIK